MRILSTVVWREGKLSTAVLGLGITASLTFFTYHVWTRQISESSGELSRFILSPVTFDGRVYALEDEAWVGEDGETPSFVLRRKASRLVRYALLARIDPIFGLSGVDGERFLAATGALERSVEAVVQSGHGGEASMHLEALQPLRFLKTLPELERLRRELVRNPDPALAGRYQNQLEQSITTAIMDLARFRQSLWEAIAAEAAKGNIPAGSNLDMIFLHTTSDTATLFRALAEVEDAFQQQMEKAKERSGCLTILRPCRAAPAFAWESDLDRWRTAAGGYRSPVNREILPLLSALWQAGGFTPEETVFWARTSCFGGRAALRPFRFTWRSPANFESSLPWWKDIVEPFRESTLLDNLYLMQLPRLPANRQSLYTSLTDQGLLLRYQQATNHYMCPEPGYLTRLATMATVVHVLKTEPLFGVENALFASLSEIGGMEDHLRRATEVTEDEISFYLSGVGALLLQEGGRSLSRDSVLRSEELLQQWYQGSAGFEHLLHYTILTNLQLIRAHGGSIESSDALYQLLSQSSPALFFFTSNPSFMGSHRPAFMRDLSRPDHALFLEFAEAKRRYRYTPGEFADVMRLTTQFFSSLGGR